MARKLSKEEWGFEVKRAMKVRKLQKDKLKNHKYVYFRKVLDRWMPFPIIIGLIAAALLFFLYGPGEFLKFFLSWVVSITIVATIVYFIWRHYEEKI